MLVTELNPLPDRWGKFGGRSGWRVIERPVRGSRKTARLALERIVGKDARLVPNGRGDVCLGARLID